LRKLLFLFFILAFSAFISAQAWVPVGNGMNGYVNSLYVDDSVLYAGGKFTFPGNNIAQWDGAKWDTLSSGIDNEVNAIAKYKGKVYMAGWFSKAGGHSAGSIATWDGANFANAGINIEGGVINSLEVYDSLLYIGGNFDSINNNYFTSGLVLWDGSLATTTGTYPYLNSIYSGPIYNGRLCVIEIPAGYSYGYIVDWDNINSFGYYPKNVFFSNGSNSVNNSITFASAICNDFLYVGGDYSKVGYNKANNIAVWSGDTAWTKVGSGTNGPVYALVAYNNLLYAGGDFDSAGGVPANNIAVWNGNSWLAIGNGVNGPVYTLAVFNGKLYAGGDFNSPGSGIAEYTGTLGVNEIETTKEAINVYPNPSGGVFTMVLSHSAITAGSQTMEVYNLLGEKVYNGMLKPVQHDEIDLSSQPNGIYFYRVIEDSGNIISEGKLIIQK